MSVLAAAGLILGNLAIIGGALIWGWRRLDAVRQMAVDWHGAPERRDPTGTVIDPARPGVQGRLVHLEVDMKSVKKELHPNSGSSFRDVVSAKLAALEAAVAELQIARPMSRASALEAASSLIAERSYQDDPEPGTVRTGFQPGGYR